MAAFAAASPPCPAAELHPAAAQSRFVFRGREPAIIAAGAAFGVTLPRAACRAAESGDRAALWLGPDEWLLLANAAEEPAVGQDLGAALTGLPHALVAVGHRNCGLEVVGPQAAAILNAGCPLDLDIGEFPVGMCTRTILGKAEIVLWRTAPESFHVEVWRSFAAYVWQFLDEARSEFR